MIKSYCVSFLIILAISQSSITSAFAVSKVPRSLNVVEFFGGGSIPVGTRDGLPGFDFFANNRFYEINSDEIYNNSFHLGINYGQLRSAHWLMSVGFRYTNLQVKDTIVLDDSTGIEVQGNPTYNQFDIDFNGNYLLADIAKSPFTPYAGLGFQAGLTSISQKGYSTTNEVSVGLRFNFGAELKLWSSDDSRSLLTFVSANSYDFYGSNNRPKYLNIGGGIKYYFRP